MGWLRNIGEVDHVYSPPSCGAMRHAKRFEHTFRWARRVFFVVLGTLLEFLAIDILFELFRERTQLSK